MALLVAPKIKAVVSTCSKNILVEGQLSGSTVKVYQNAVNLIGQTISNSGEVWVPINAGVILAQGDKITATQTLGPDTSPQTPAPMEVQAVPAAPPAPIFKSHLYACGSCLWLGGLVSGASYKIIGQDKLTGLDELRGQGSTSGGDAHVVLNQPLWPGEKLRASQDACGLGSVEANAQPADMYPAPILPPPVVKEPLFKCDTNVYGEKGVPGAAVYLKREKNGAIIQLTQQCSLGGANFWAIPILDAGEQVVMWQEFAGGKKENECATRSPNSVVAIVNDVTLIDPPVVLEPLCAGGVVVTLTKLRPGAKVTIFHDGKEYIGQSSGNGPQDFMVEPLTGGKTVHAVQEQCGHTSGESNKVPVNMLEEDMPPPVVQDPLFSCTDTVHVSNIHSGALVMVFSKSIGLIGQAWIYDDEANILITPALVEGDVIYAIQQGCGKISGKSNEVKVQKTVEFNPPEIVKPLYDCGNHVWVKNVVPGAIVEVYVNGVFAGQATIADEEGSVAVFNDLNLGDKVKVRQRLCDLVSNFSSEVTVEAFQGRWEMIPWIDTNGKSIPDDQKILAVHATLLRTGKILFFGGDQHAPDLIDSKDVDHTRLLDCTTLRIKKITGLINPPSDLFCSGHAQTRYGDLLVAGGTSGWVSQANIPHKGHFIGSRDCWIFDAGSEAWDRKALLSTQRPTDYVNYHFAIWQAQNPAASPAEIAAKTASLQAEADVNNPNARIQKTGGKWYPTVLAMPDGKLICVSGHPLDLDTRHNNNSLETYDLSTDSWTFVGNKDADKVPVAEGRTYEYPRLFILSDGSMFSAMTMVDGNVHRWVSGNDPDNWLHVAGAAPASDPNNPINSTLYGSAVLLPFRLNPQQAGKYLPEQVMVMGDVQPQIISPTLAPANWQNTAARKLGAPNPPQRRNHNSVILPTGEIFVEGGVRNIFDDDTHVKNAELFNPYTNEWSVLPPADVVRNYHHVSLLMPNGAVYVGGSNVNSETGLSNRHFEIEIFKPWYFCGQRPVLKSVPQKASHEERFTISSPDSAKIKKVVIVKCGTTTHNFNCDQRHIELPFSMGDKPDTLLVTMTDNPNIAIIGYYLLFILDGKNVPSEGKFIQVTLKSKCYIAGAVYGAHSAETDILRHWRDTGLLHSTGGRLFVRIYYALSPTLAKILPSIPGATGLTRRILQPIVARLKRKYGKE